MTNEKAPPTPGIEGDEARAVAAECVRYANMRYAERGGDRALLLTAVLRKAASLLLAFAKPSPASEAEQCEGCRIWQATAASEAERGNELQSELRALKADPKTYAQGIDDAAKVARAHRAPIGVPQIDYDQACDDVEAAILKLLSPDEADGGGK